MSDEKRGLYQKYIVTRSDGSSGPSGKHEHCSYFVLDMNHDPHAKAALVAYAQSCEEQFPALANDLIYLAAQMPFGNGDDVRLSDVLAVETSEREPWRCTICNNMNPDDATHCRQCEYSRMVMRHGQRVPRDGRL